MTEKDLVQKLNLLKEIQPEKDWMVSVKRQFLPESPKNSLADQILEVFRVFPSANRFSLKPVFISLVTLALMATGTIGLAQMALPGDFLYPVKKLTEKANQALTAKNDLPKVNLELAQKRLNELTQVAEKNQVRNLAPALNEYKQSVDQVAKDLKGSRPTKEIVQETEKLKQGEAKIEALGVNVAEPEELNSVLSQMADREIKELETKTLSESQAKLLQEAKKDYSEGNFSQALETIILLSYPQDKQD